VVELLDRFSYEEGQNVSMYRLLTDTLSRLSTEADPLVAVRYYEVRLLDLLGFRPHLLNCAHCGNEIQAEDQYFSAVQGGVLCPSCGANDLSARPVSMPALKYLRHFQRSNYTEAARAHLSPTIDAEMERLMQYYLTYLLERGLNSPSFLRRLRMESSGE
jgi:DNA repair protein RecO (recombination protein O)